MVVQTESRLLVFLFVLSVAAALPATAAPPQLEPPALAQIGALVEHKLGLASHRVVEILWREPVRFRVYPRSRARGRPSVDNLDAGSDEETLVSCASNSLGNASERRTGGAAP
jgi:hypothetical protein